MTHSIRRPSQNEGLGWPSCKRRALPGSWRSNRTTAYQQHQDALERYHKRQAHGQLPAKVKEPRWREWNVPTLREPCIQANVNVVKLEASRDSTYDYWLTISTLEKGQPIQVPVKLAGYHKATLTDPNQDPPGEEAQQQRATQSAGRRVVAHALL